jgi:hypothetical protein
MPSSYDIDSNTLAITAIAHLFVSTPDWDTEMLDQVAHILTVNGITENCPHEDDDGWQCGLLKLVAKPCPCQHTKPDDYLASSTMTAIVTSLANLVDGVNHQANSIALLINRLTKIEAGLACLDAPGF